LQDDRYRTDTGEDKAWSELAAAGPVEVAANSGASYDSATGLFTIKILGSPYTVDPAARTLTDAQSPGNPPEYFLNLSTPIYLVHARPVPPSGRLVREFTGGEFFFRGAHTLPLDAIAEKYGSDGNLFKRACSEALGGVPAEIGDAACSFSVYPRVSMTFVLWLSDEEFPARAGLLFDSNAGMHMPLDVVWAVALLACQRLLKY
jgi:hypothetical protein